MDLSTRLLLLVATTYRLPVVVLCSFSRDFQLFSFGWCDSVAPTTVGVHEDGGDHFSLQWTWFSAATRSATTR